MAASISCCARRSLRPRGNTTSSLATATAFYCYFCNVLITIFLPVSHGWVVTPSCAYPPSSTPWRNVAPSPPLKVNFYSVKKSRQRRSARLRHLFLFSTSRQNPLPPEKDRNEQAVASVYNCPILYDLAFGYRNFEAEVEFLIDVHQQARAQSSSSSSTLPSSSSTPPSPLRVLELAAGPARHALAALALPGMVVEHATALDSSSAMAAYAKQLQKDAADDDTDNKLDYIVADMRQFTIPSSSPSSSSESSSSPPFLFDTAWILLGSLQHLLKNDHVIECFQSVHRVLKPYGTLILELPHPTQEVFNMVECTRNTWTVPIELELLQPNNMITKNAPCDDDFDDNVSGGGGGGNTTTESDKSTTKKKLVIVWGDEDDRLDPIRQVRDFTVEFQVQGCTQEELQRLGIVPTPSTSFSSTSTSSTRRPRIKSSSSRSSNSIRQMVPMRLFTAQEIDALARCAGFRVVKMYGALDPDVIVDIEDEDLAFRMVCVLQKVS